ncbi:MAG: hypothetical protein Q4D76_13915 [Oscillospiraceae bacterium]|nr:hypothetical protein [Oscillospiraceae bacterium]
MDIYTIKPEYSLYFDDSEINSISEYCINSEFQFLNEGPLKFKIQFGDDFSEADFYIINNAVPVFSIDLYNCILSAIQSNYECYFINKKIYIEYEGRNYNYVMILPLRINCIDSEDFSIIEDKIGSMNMFKTIDTSDNSIYINEKIYKKISEYRPYGLLIDKYN